MWKTFRETSEKTVYFSDLQNKHVNPKEANKAFMASVIVSLGDDDHEDNLEEPSINYDQKYSCEPDESDEEIFLVQDRQ